MQITDAASQYEGLALRRLQALLGELNGASALAWAQIGIALTWLVVDGFRVFSEVSVVGWYSLAALAGYVLLCLVRVIRSRAYQRMIRLEVCFVDQADQELLHRLGSKVMSHLWTVSKIYQADWSAHAAAQVADSADEIPYNDIQRLYRRALRTLIPSRIALQGLVVAGILIALLPERSLTEPALWMGWFLIGGLALLTEGVQISRGLRMQSLVTELRDILSSWSRERIAITMTLRQISMPYTHRCIYRAQPWFIHQKAAA